MAEIKHLEGHLPDREGTFGRAWRSSLGNGARELGVLSAWVIYAPRAHPLWAYYALAVIHLRPIPGAPEVEILRPDATHQVMLVALSPDRSPSVENPFSTQMHPMNFAAQWNAASDIDAEQKIESCVEEIIAGQLSPDADYTRQWIARFNDSMLA